MLKKTVNYKNFNGKERTKDLYFHLTQTELTEIALDLPDNVKEIFADHPGEVTEEDNNRILRELGNKGIFEFLKKLVLKAYGIRDEDGEYFDKSDEITRKFQNSLAFDAVMTELTRDDAVALNFINSLIPQSAANALPSNNVQEFPAK